MSLINLRVSRYTRSVRARPVTRGLVLTAAVWAIRAPTAPQTYTFERSFKAGTVVRLDISTHRGDIHVTASDDDDVSVSGNVAVRTGFNMPLNSGQLASGLAARPPIELKGTTLQIRPPDDPLVDRAVSVSVDVRVPAPTPVVAVNDSGRIVIDALAGPLSARTQSGAIDASVATGAGVMLDASTQDGTITIEQLAVDGTTSRTRAKGAIRGGGPTWQIVSRRGAIRVR
jgi:hypothetical protein